VSHFIDCYANCRYANYSYAECRYAESRYADCRGAFKLLYCVHAPTQCLQNVLAYF